MDEQLKVFDVVICEVCECPIDPNLIHTEIGSECICDLKEEE
jgi:hypothetical protein